MLRYKILTFSLDVFSFPIQDNVKWPPASFPNVERKPLLATRVPLHVARKRSAVQKTAATRTALERSTTRVQTRVDGKVNLLREAFVAHDTLVRL